MMAYMPKLQIFQKVNLSRLQKKYLLKPKNRQTDKNMWWTLKENTLEMPNSENINYRDGSEECAHFYISFSF